MNKFYFVLEYLVPKKPPLLIKKWFLEFHQLIYIETSTKFCYNIFKDEVHNAVQAFPLLFLFNFLAILKRVAFLI